MFRKAKQLVFIGCDIDPPRVLLVAFCLSKHEKTAELILHEQFDLRPEVDDVRLFQESLRALEAFLRRISLILKEVREIHISLPYSAAQADMYEFKMTRANPAASITPEELALYWKSAKRAAARSYQDESEPFAHFPPELDHISLDGYRLLHNVAARGKELAFSITLSAWPRMLEEELDHFKIRYPHLPIFLYPRISSIHESVHFELGIDASGVVFDIGEYASGLLFYQGGVLAFERVFQFGGADLRRIVGKYFRLPEKSVAVLLSQWQEGRLLPETIKKLQEAMARTLDFWKREWQQALLEASKTVVVTPRFYVLGRYASLPVWSAALQDPDWHAAFAAGSEAEVSILHPTDTVSAHFSGWPFHSPEDTVLFSLVSRIIQKEMH
ncbi:MAG: hypothetical protein HY220_04375 [Candidatus Sungbacteria bacterium]|uniref:SHS2 domain-containing protein n=1 Tax=Candidatus Sungiibacteriota bacterium TaxID=2750080 RepID=A0A9D6LTS0_9BACT|nr:hypothetical protein [Candidatus Sungbacteria bacterium]